MKKKVKQGGIIFKDCFCPYWGGGAEYKEKPIIFRPGLANVSVTILGENHHAGIVEIYEEDKQIRSEPFEG